VKLTRKQVLAGAAAGALGAAGAYELVDRLAGSSPERAAAGPLPPEQHILEGVRTVKDNGVVVTFLHNIHVLGSNGRLLATSAAVIAGITYNFLPFMVLPLYVSLEQVDPRLIEAAGDLYANRVVSFLRVTLPLSLPGVFAGTLLTFIPATGDFINAQLLGSPNQQMIGTVIQNQFLEVRDYPLAASLSFVLMTLITLGVLAYARVLGTEELA